MHDRPGDHQALGHAARELVDFGPAAEQPEPLQQLLGRRPGPTVAHAEVTTVEVQVLEHVERSIERVRLRDDADDLLGEGRVRDDVDPADGGAAPRSG